MSRDLARGNVSGGVNIKTPVLLCIWKLYSREMQFFCTFLIDINVSKNFIYFNICEQLNHLENIEVNLEKVLFLGFFFFWIIMGFICWTTQKFPAPSSWTCTEPLLTTPRPPNTKLTCLLETRWKLLRRTRTVRRFIRFGTARPRSSASMTLMRAGVSCLLPAVSGWWFCQIDSKRGWVPASYLEPLDGPEESEEAEPDYEGKLRHLLIISKWIWIWVCWCAPAGELYVTIKAYKAEQQDEISLDLGERIEVIHKLLDGWWVVR